MGFFKNQFSLVFCLMCFNLALEKKALRTVTNSFVEEIKQIRLIL